MDVSKNTKGDTTTETFIFGSSLARDITIVMSRSVSCLVALIILLIHGHSIPSESHEYLKYPAKMAQTGVNVQ